MGSDESATKTEANDRRYPRCLRPFEWTEIKRLVRQTEKLTGSLSAALCSWFCDGIVWIMRRFFNTPPFHRLTLEGREYSYDRDGILADFLRDLTINYSSDITLNIANGGIKYFDGVSIYCEGRILLPEVFLSSLLPSALVELNIGSNMFLLKSSEFVAGQQCHFNRIFHIPVEVKTLFGVTMDLCMVDLRQTVESLKLRITEATGVPAAAQSLLFCGNILKDGQQLGSYGIKSYDAIYLHQNLRGGAKKGKCPDQFCNCLSYCSLTGCCNVCRQSCQCKECISPEINSLRMVNATNALVAAGFAANPAADKTPMKAAALIK